MSPLPPVPATSSFLSRGAERNNVLARLVLNAAWFSRGCDREDPRGNEAAFRTKDNPPGKWSPDWWKRKLHYIVSLW